MIPLQNPMRTTKTRTPRKRDHCYIFKATWRGTALKLRIEADDLEYAYRIAESTVRKMEGGAACLGVDCIEQVY